MKRLLIVALGTFLSGSVALAATGTPPAKGAARQEAQGVKNAKKVMQARFDREKKMAEVRKQAQGKKHQAQGK